MSVTPQSNDPSRADAKLNQTISLLTRGGSKGCKLFQTGDWQKAGFADLVQADRVLCTQIAIFGGRNPEVVDRVYRASKLFDPTHWDRDEGKYRLGIIQDAIREADEFRKRLSHPPQTEIPEPVIQLYTLAELRAADLPSPEPVVDGLINAGETVLLVGRPKVGKSRLVQQLTLSLSRGEPWLGKTIPCPRRVLLLDLENRPSGVKKRFAAMSAPGESDDRVVIYAPDTLANDGLNSSEDGMKQVEKLIARAHPDVLMIDTWRLFVGGDENKPEVVVNALKAISNLRKNSPGLVVILVHHLRKEKFDAPVRLHEDPCSWMEAVSGHHALVGHVDACYGLERHLDSLGEELIVFGGVARNTWPTALLLDDDEDTLLFTVRSGEAAAISAMTGKECLIWGVARGLGQFSFGELLDAAKTKNRKAVTSTLRKAESHHVLRRDGKLYVVSV
jgi:hypothetical protein